MIVFLGDSITAAWPLHRLALPERAVNAGVGGETSTMMLARFGRDVAAREASGLHLLAGINDIAENGGPVTVDGVADTIGRIVRAAQDLGLRIVLGTVGPATHIPWRPAIVPQPKILALNARLRALVRAEQGIVLADYHAALLDEDGGLRADCTTDGVHLSARGYATIAPVARVAIEEADRLRRGA